MAVTTTYKRQEDTAKNTQQVQSTQPYQGMQGVSQNTSNNLGNYQAGYQQSDKVTQAQNTLQQVQSQKPQGYSSKYTPMMDSIMEQIQNPKDFKYEFNGDNVFNAYKDLYTQNAKQASMDAMGQAAGLTGGYGNSYGQAVATQQYQQNLLPLYEKGMQLRDAAYQKYRDDQNALKDRYGMLAGQEESDYGRYRDTVGDYQREEELAYNRAAQAEENDYNRYMQELEYWTGLAQVENADYRSEAERQEAIRQYEQDFAERQRQYDTTMAENQRLYNTDDEFRRYQLQVAQEQFNAEQQEKIRQFNEQLAYDRERSNKSDEQWEKEMLERTRQFNEQLAEDRRQFDLDMEYRQDEFKYRWGLNAPAVVEEAPAASSYTPSPSPNPNPGEEKPKATVSWLTTTGNKIAAAAAAQKAQEDGKKLTERKKSTT